MTYRVSTTPDGDNRWWCEGDDISAHHTGIRTATAGETMLMDKIISHKNPPAAWGDKLRDLMAEAPST